MGQGSTLVLTHLVSSYRPCSVKPARRFNPDSATPSLTALAIFSDAVWQKKTTEDKSQRWLLIPGSVRPIAAPALPLPISLHHLPVVRAPRESTPSPRGRPSRRTHACQSQFKALQPRVPQKPRRGTLVSNAVTGDGKTGLVRVETRRKSMPNSREPRGGRPPPFMGPQPSPDPLLAHLGSHSLGAHEFQSHQLSTQTTNQ